MFPITAATGRGLEDRSCDEVNKELLVEERRGEVVVDRRGEEVVYRIDEDVDKRDEVEADRTGEVEERSGAADDEHRRGEETILGIREGASFNNDFC